MLHAPRLFTVQVSWLLGWGRATGVCWLQHVTAAAVGPAAVPGLTPLHLAVLLGDAAQVADMLTGGERCVMFILSANCCGCCGSAAGGCSAGGRHAHM
jgi:hypothetical protein